MKLINSLVSIFMIIGLIIISGCNENNGCSDCGGTLIDGYYFVRVTPETISEFVEDIPNVEINACVRYKLISSEKEDLTVVDDCCCE